MSIAQNFPEIKPSLNLDFANTKKLDSRITFSRPTVGTYYDGQTVAKAEENLFLRSQEFDNASWNKIRLTVTTNNTTAPDGTNTAEETIQASGQTLNGVVFQTTTGVIGQTYSASAFAKANTKNYAFVFIQDGATLRGANFDLTSGTVGTIESGVTASIVSEVDGWYRCIVTRTISTSTVLSSGVYHRDTDNSTTVVDSGGIYLWGAQLEQRDTVTAYTPTTTQPITNYIPTLLSAPANTARFDHNPVTGESLGLLVEEQRTNLLLRSEEFENASWLKFASTVVPNSIVAPDGTLTADKVVATATSASYHGLQSNVGITVSSGTSYTWSVYAKAGEYNWIGVIAYTGLQSFFSWVNLSDGTLGTSAIGNSVSISPVGNDWYKISLTRTTVDTTTYFICYASNAEGTAGAGPTYTGDGYSGIYIWGAQLEAGAFPTSYIKTEASQVTRSADSASMTGANFSEWYRQDEGTLYAEAITNSTGVPSFFSVSDGTSANRLQLRKNSTQGNVSMVRENATQVSITAGSWTTSLQKASVSYKVNDVALSSGGSAVATDTSVILPIVNQAEIGYGYGSVHANGHIKKIAYYPARLTNTQLQALTS